MNTPTYPIVQFLVARGKGIAVALGALVALAAVFGGWASGSVWLACVGLVGAVVVVVLLLSYVEVLGIIADTLLPKY